MPCRTCYLEWSQQKVHFFRATSMGACDVHKEGGLDVAYIHSVRNHEISNEATVNTASAHSKNSNLDNEERHGHIKLKVKWSSRSAARCRRFPGSHDCKFNILFIFMCISLKQFVSFWLCCLLTRGRTASWNSGTLIFVFDRWNIYVCVHLCTSS